MPGYSLDSDTFTRDGWYTVWPPGRGLGPALHERSWPDYLSLRKLNEFLDGVGRLRRMRTASDVQEELARRYAVIQEHVWTLCLDAMIPAARMSPVPPATEFTKRTVRAEYIVAATAEARPPIGRDAALEQARHDLLARSDGRLTDLRDTSVAGDPAVVAAGTVTGPDGFVAERRAVVIHPADRGVSARLILHTDFADTATTIDDVLIDILANTTITEDEPLGIDG